MGQQKSRESDPLFGVESTTQQQQQAHRRGNSAFSFLSFNQTEGVMRGGTRPSLLSARGYTSMSNRLVGSVSRGLAVIAEEVATSAVDVKDAFVEKLNDADAGGTYFLETSLTRGIAVVPERLPDFVEEAVGVSMRELQVGEEEEEEIKEEEFALLPPGKAAAAMVGPYISLLGAVVAVSSNGTAMSLLKGVAPPLKLYWRMTGTAALLSIFACRTVYREGRPRLTPAQWTTFLGAAACFACHALLFVIAIDFTSIGNAVIYANSQAVLLLMGKAFVGEPIVFAEGIGALAAFAGAIICSVDSEGSSSADQSEGGEEDSNSRAIWGDLLALSAALAGVGYLTFARAVKPHMHVTVFMFSVMLCGSFLVLTFMAVTGVPLSFTTDPYHGLFGWMTPRPDRLLVEVWVVVICNVIGAMGFVRAMAHLDNLVIAVATLMEPAIASVVAYVMKVGLLPGPLGWFGNALVAVGTLGVVYPSVNKGGPAH